MRRSEALQALRDVGLELEESGAGDPVTIILGGAVAGMILGSLSPSRVTQDCDVLATEPDDRWGDLSAAARRVAHKRGLPPTWLNQEGRMFVHRLPLGWRGRCDRVGHFGPLEVVAVSRLDLMGMKLISAPERPQDIEDIIAMGPTDAECRALAAHLDRLEAEALDREEYSASRAILDHMARGNEDA